METQCRDDSCDMQYYASICCSDSVSVCGYCNSYSYSYSFSHGYDVPECVRDCNRECASDLSCMDDCDGIGRGFICEYCVYNADEVN